MVEVRPCRPEEVAEALVAFDDADAIAFWEAAGYARDPDIGRMVRTL